MSLKAKIEAVIYASEEPVTLQQLVALLGDEAGAELDRIAAEQGTLPVESLDGAGDPASVDTPASEIGEREQRAGVEPSPDESAEYTEHASEGSAAADTKRVNAVPAESMDGAPVSAADPVEPAAPDASEAEKRKRERAVREHIRRATDSLIREYATGDRGIEIREVASGYRMATKPEYHDAVRGFVKSLKPALKLTLPALETLAVVAYKQPVTAAELSEIRGVDSSGVLGGLLARKLIATAGRKQVIGRPMLYKTTRDFLLRFGLKDVNELPSMDEFERMAGELVEPDDLSAEQTAGIVEEANARGDAEHIREVTGGAPSVNTDEVGDTDESDDALEAEAAALASDTIATEKATAETAAGGNHGRDNEPAAAAPLHTTQAGDITTERESG